MYSVVLTKNGGVSLPNEEMEELKRISFQDLCLFHKEWFNSVRVESLFVGNISSPQVEHASKAIDGIISQLRANTKPLDADKIPEVRVIRLPDNQSWFFER